MSLAAKVGFGYKDGKVRSVLRAENEAVFHMWKFAYLFATVEVTGLSNDIEEG